MELCKVDEVKSIQLLLNKINDMKEKIMERIKTIDEKKLCLNETNLTEYEILMKNYYIRNGNRHIKEAEEALFLSKEAEESYNKNSKKWSE